MKKLLLLLMFTPLVSFGQDYNDLSLERTAFYQKKTEGIFYFRKGIFYVTAVANSGFTSIKKMTRKAEGKMKDFALKNNFKYELIKVDEEKGGVGKYTTSINWYRVFNSDGTLVYDQSDKEENSKENLTDESKNNAIDELKKLKEILDLELITKEEYDKKAAELKKIILGN